MFANSNPGGRAILMLLALILSIPALTLLSEGSAVEMDGEGEGSLTTSGGAALTITPNSDYNLFPLYNYNFTFSFPANDLTHFNLTFIHDNFRFGIRGGFLRSFHADTSEAEEYADIPPEGITLLRTSSGWNLSMRIRMYWTLPEGNYSLELRVFNNSGKEWKYLWKDAFFYSKRIGINWHGNLLDEQGRNILGKWVKGREKVLISNVILNFYTRDGNRSSFIPIMDDFNFTLDGGDFNNWRWHLSTSLSNNGYYSLPLITPTTSGKLDCVLSLDNLPPGASIVRKLSFTLYVDSENPTIVYKENTRQDGTITFRMLVEDQYSGVERSGLTSRIFYGRDDLKPIKIISTFYDGGVYGLQVPYSGAGYYHVETTAVDRAGNVEKTNITVEIGSENMGDLALIGCRVIGLAVLNRSVAIEVSVGNLGDKDVEGATLSVWQDSNPTHSLNLGLLKAGERRKINIKIECSHPNHNISLLITPPPGFEDHDMSNNRLELEIEPVLVDLDLLNAEAVLNNEDEVTFKAEIAYHGVEPLNDMEYNILYDSLLVKADTVVHLSPGHTYVINVTLFASKSYSNITIVLDPHDMLLESNEKNNIANVPNPLLSPIPETPPPQPDLSEEKPNQESAPESDEESDNQQGENNASQTGGEEDTTEEIGGTTLGEGGSLNGGKDNVVILPNVPDDEDGGGNGWGGLPVAVVVIQTFLTLLLFVEVLHREALRYKLLSLFVPLYSKLKKEKLESGVRWEILGYLKAKPYATYSELKRDLGLTNGTLMHHLRILEREELIRSRRVGKYKIFYHMDKRMPENFSYLSPIKKRLLEYIMDNPGTVQKSLSRIFKKSQTDLNYHLNELYRMGLIKKKREGKYVKYYPV